MPDCVAAHTGIVNFIELIHILGNCNDNIHSPSPSPANNSKYIILKLHIITAGHLFPFFRSISHDDLVYARIYYIPFTNTRTRARKYDSLLIICQFAMAWSVRTFGTEFVFCSPFLYLSRISLTTFGSTELLLSSSIILFGWMFATLWCVKYIRSRRRLTVCVPQQQSFWWCFEWQWSENKLLDISELARSLALPLAERELCLSFSFPPFSHSTSFRRHRNDDGDDIHTIHSIFIHCFSNVQKFSFYYATNNRWYAICILQLHSAWVSSLVFAPSHQKNVSILFVFRLCFVLFNNFIHSRTHTCTWTHTKQIHAKI